MVTRGLATIIFLFLSKELFPLLVAVVKPIPAVLFVNHLFYTNYTHAVIKLLNHMIC